MEEEEAQDDNQRPIGLGIAKTKPVKEKEPQQTISNETIDRIYNQLMDERKTILENEKLSPRDKFKLLEANRKTLLIARGGTIRKRENVVYSILAFGGGVLIILALLTTFAGLPSEVTLSFLELFLAEQ